MLATYVRGHQIRVLLLLVVVGGESRELIQLLNPGLDCGKLRRLCRHSSLWPASHRWHRLYRNTETRDTTQITSVFVLFFSRKSPFAMVLAPGLVVFVPDRGFLAVGVGACGGLWVDSHVRSPLHFSESVCLREMVAVGDFPISHTIWFKPNHEVLDIVWHLQTLFYIWIPDCDPEPRGADYFVHGSFFSESSNHLRTITRSLTRLTEQLA